MTPVRISKVRKMVAHVSTMSVMKNVVSGQTSRPRDRAKVLTVQIALNLAASDTPSHSTRPSNS